MARTLTRIAWLPTESNRAILIVLACTPNERPARRQSSEAALPRRADKRERLKDRRILKRSACPKCLSALAQASAIFVLFLFIFFFVVLVFIILVVFVLCIILFDEFPVVLLVLVVFIFLV